MNERKMDGRITKWIAWHLPRHIVLWCYIRVMANATTGEGSGQTPDEITYEQAYRRWVKR